MQLNHNGRAMGLVMLLVGGLHLTACSGDENTPDGGIVTVKDATNPDATNPTDTGPRPDGGDASTGPGDASDSGVIGRDADTGVNPGSCPRGSEGCLCNTDDSCGTGLTCIEWPATDEANPIRTCAIACEDDTACAATTQMNTLCRAFITSDSDVNNPTATPPIAGACVRAEAQSGQSCFGSRRGNRQMTGCAADLTCMTNRIGDDEGTCAQLCIVSTSTPTGGCEGATPHCSPGGTGLVVTSTGGEQVQVGICTVRAIKQGEICSRTDLTQSCDQSSATVLAGNGHACIGFPDLPTGNGVCVEVCDRAGGSCANNEPGLGLAVCTPYVPEADDPDAALCVDACSNNPDNCGGRGLGGTGTNGRFCENTWVFDQAFPVSFCVDRRTPALNEGSITGAATGQPMVEPGFDNCRPGQGSNGDVYRCPESTFCLTLQQGNPGTGGCFRGCTTATTATTTGCLTTGTATICVPLADDSTEGLCAGN